MVKVLASSIVSFLVHVNQLLPSSPAWTASPNVTAAGSPRETLLRLLQGEDTCHSPLHKDQSRHELWHAYVTATIHSSFFHKNRLSNYRKLSQKDHYWCTKEIQGSHNISIFHVVFFTLLFFPDLASSTSPWVLQSLVPYISLNIFLLDHITNFSGYDSQDQVTEHQINTITKNVRIHICKIININFYLSCNATGSCILSISNFLSKWCKQKSLVSKAEILHELQLHQQISERHFSEACAVKESPGFYISSQLDFKVSSLS